ncbi:MAG: hypothetical protein RIQ60_4037 [Pseudomonadota bacterium]|jgi:ribosome-associated protein
MQDISFELRGDHITLDRLLKATGLAHSGAWAKSLVADGQVTVDGQVELRKSAKIRAGQWVEFAGTTLRVQAAPAPPEPGADPA